MIQIGRLCMKIAGRDAGQRCVVVDILDDKYVLIDGETRRRKCNLMHLEPLKDSINIKKNAAHEEIKTEFEKLGFNIRETKPKEKKDRPRKIRKLKKVSKDKKGKDKKGKKPKTKSTSKNIIPKNEDVEKTKSGQKDNK